MSDNAEVYRDISIIRRLSRIAAAGGKLSEKASKALADLRAKYPDFEPEAGDRDDFDVYHSGGFRGPRGNPDILKDVSIDKLVETALSIQAAEQWEQGDLWSTLCRSEPSRAIQAVEAAAANQNWPANAWRPFLESVAESKEVKISEKVLALLLAAPSALFVDAVFAVGSWMYRQLSTFKHNGVLAPDYLALWDKFGALVYGEQPIETLEREYKNDLPTAAINDPGGLLALILLDTLIARKVDQDAGLPNDLKDRATLAVSGTHQSSLLARIIFCERLALTDSIDHQWTNERLVSTLIVGAPNWREMWRARAFDGHPGLARLFNPLKPSLLACLARPDLAHDEGQSLAAQLLRAYIWKRNDAASGYEIETSEIRQALSAASQGTRQAIAWIFMNWLRTRSEVDTTSPDQRWNEGIGRTFREVWPKDANLRDQHTSQQLLWMALSCDVCFPEAASFIENLIVPLQVYRIDITFDFDKGGRERMTSYPRPFLKLLNAAIDPHSERIPDDLGDILTSLEHADPAIVNDNGFNRLSGAWRMRQSGR